LNLLQQAARCVLEADVNATIPAVQGRAESFDRIGMLVSILCGAHCLIGSLVVASAGMLSTLTSERVELGLVSVAAAIAALSIGLGFRKHRTAGPLGLLAAALVALVAARVVEGGELMLSLVGAGLLVLAHATNLRALQRWRGCC
jgi:hypothetical protein